ncbi:hypothetical protein GPALN_004126 [Globodera pallida]|uniref:F-box domain-containing protein n=1 Tax=Globodera pallida TaxID=36090 RepID=A0A183BWP2_GLOPA|nr:hypothetical protein GPALN_004126 [Globodera pallida]
MAQKRKRQNKDLPCSSTNADADQCPFPLEQLPLNTLVIVASQLPFKDFKNVGMISKQLNRAQRITRFSRKRVSVDMLRKLFPDEVPDSKMDGTERSIGMLEMMNPMRQHLRSSPPRNIREVDLSEFSSFRESHFVELFRSISNGRDLFSDVRRLNVQKCVMELRDMDFLAQLMPKVWHIRCSAQSLVIPQETEQQQMALNAEQMRQLRAKLENFDVVSRQCTKKHLWFITKLIEMFAELEVIQLDN